MNRKQESENDMYDVLISFLNATPTEIMIMLIHFPGYYNSFKAAVATLFASMEAQSQDRSGYAQNKANLRIALNSALMDLSSKLMAYATYIEDPVLFNMIDFNKSALEKATDTEISVYAQTILNSGTEHVADLAEYGVTVASLADNANLLESYRIAKPKPENARKDKKTATAEIKAAIREAKKFLKKMDGVVLTVQQTQPAFVQSYLEKRKAVDPYTSTLSATGLVTDENGVPLPYVHMTSGQLNIKRDISVNGTFIIRHGGEGVKNLTFSYPGYETQTVQVTFRAHCRANVVVVMKLRG